MTGAASPALELRDLRTSLRTGARLVAVLDGVSATLYAGRTLGVVGESGSGKTTLLRSTMGLLPPGSQTSGEVLLHGVDLNLAPRERRKAWGRRIAMAFQDPTTALNPVLRVGRQVDECLARAGWRPGPARARAVELLGTVGVPEPEIRARQYPHELSTGLRQLVCVAIALAGEPEVLLADEPTTALDAGRAGRVLDLIQAQQARRGMAVLIATHDLATLRGRSDEILVLYDGRVVERASTQAIFQSPRMPYTAALLACSLQVERPHASSLPVVAGTSRGPLPVDRGCSFTERCERATLRCRAERPALSTVAAAHAVACWHPLPLRGL